MRILKRCTAVMMAVVLLLSTTLCFTFTTEATGIKQTKTYEIAVVFDNSGSMYDNQAWCRAKYAMEIFASMLDLDSGNDVLKVFPMWEVTTDGSTSGGSYSAIEIRSSSDIDKLHNLYTPSPGSTPFAPIQEAYGTLQSSQASEKWLIVLTDGAFNQEARKQSASIDLQSRLSAMADGTINVQYLGIGSAATLTADESRGFYTKTSTDTSLKDDLVQICNQIFERSELTGALSGNTLTLDISMSKLIVFIQGQGAQISSLTDASGNSITVQSDSGQITYSTLSAGTEKYQNAPVDDTLAGQVVTYSSCAKGTYTLNYSGASEGDIQIFYEPDVDVNITLTDSDGNVYTGDTDSIPAGEYTVEYKLVDAQTGEDVTNNPLMGNVDLTGYVKQDGTTVQDNIASGDKVTLEPGGETEIHVSGTYLTDFTISTESTGNGIHISLVNNPGSELKVKVKSLQTSAWYVPRDWENWKPIRVSLTLNGNPLTDEEMARTELALEFSEDIPYRCVMVPGESAYDIYIGQDENGNQVDITFEGTGHEYTVTATVTYTDEYGESTSASDSCKFTVSLVPMWLAWLLRNLWWILLLIALIIAIHTIRNMKAYPSKIFFDDGFSSSRKPINGKRFMLSDGTVALSGTARKVTEVKHCWSRHAQFDWVLDTPDSDILEIKIGNTSKLTRNAAGNFVKGAGHGAKKFDFKTNPFRISDGANISCKALDAAGNTFVYKGQIKINHQK